MAEWTDAQLHAVEVTDEVRVAFLTLGADSVRRRSVTIWAVKVTDAVYIRSARGPQQGWFTHARASGIGWFTVNSIERATAFAVVLPREKALHGRLDAAYHAKYDLYGPQIVGSVVGPRAAKATLRVTPTD